jgi:prepilin-type N-terminal cleavage/methylation domain-containing protein
MRDQRGFTLIEVIVTITVAAILAALIVPFMSTTIIASAKGVGTVADEARLKTVMEDITRDYRDWLRSTPGSPLSAFAAQLTSNPAYSAFITEAQTGIEVDSGNDGDVTILRITISTGDLSLRALFTQVI